MKVYDWLVVGAGLTGAALSYELSKAGFSVLLIEENQDSANATRFSYGGIPYWSGTSPLTTQLASEGINRYHELSAELDQDFEFRNIDLLLTIASNTNPHTTRSQYNHFAIQPQLLDVNAACELEPMINPEAISGAIHFNHAHVNPQLLVKAYLSGLSAHGGEICLDQVTGFTREGVSTLKSNYFSKNMAVCAGGIGRSLLQNAGISTRLCFTHAEVIETIPSELTLRSLVMPAVSERFILESQSSNLDEVWNYDNYEVSPPSIDVGAIQFKNRQLRIGQLSMAHTNPHLERDLKQSEISIREQVNKVLPAIASVRGSCHHCLVAFSPDSLPLIGKVAGNIAGNIAENIYLFSGFTSPFVYVPTLAKRFALSVSGNFDPLISQLSPQRFGNS